MRKEKCPAGECVPKKARNGLVFCAKCEYATSESEVKRKKYLVDVRSHTSAKMIVFANSKEEAWKIADQDMRESMKRQLDNAIPNPMIQDLDGYAEAMKSNIEILQGDDRPQRKAKRPKCSDPELSHDCTGCTDRHSEGTHQGCTKQHGHVGCDRATSDAWPA